VGTGQKTCDKKNPEMHIILYLDLRQGITFMASDIHVYANLKLGM
jgi:hypothetical protein